MAPEARMTYKFVKPSVFLVEREEKSKKTQQIFTMNKSQIFAEKIELGDKIQKKIKV